ncbi:hypothetical protein [Mesorhizobium sp. M8A.F.Ca.ET.021.01.1.1]|uniref:LexA family protein n=1 Tax=Mesorhizobium sp. M8A.F.Ca.ET.021.01.1.1 TaxID=2496757 RepID=UPI0011AE9ACA|nr:hypothetical protein [Mesorhizobium sp. M8A.F.Ca.ET.021.01.1.1]
MRVVASSPTIVRGMSQQHDTKAWIEAVARYMNLSLSELSLNSGMAASTITRYMNDKSGRLSVTDRTLEAIATYSGIPKNVMPGQRRLPGFGESETLPHDMERDEPLPSWVTTAIAAHKGNRNGVDAWVMKGWALDLLGILPGDIVLIDQNRRPKSGDIVLAQLTDLVTQRTETVMRRYEAPFITTHSSKLGPSRPEQVDDDRVVIMGVEVGVIRPRH